MENRISTAEASKMTGIPEQAIRVQMQRGLLDFGSCTRLTGSRYAYYIMRKKVEKYVRGEK